MKYTPTICPLDGNIFDVSPGSLPLHPSPQAISPPAYQGPQYPSEQHYQSPEQYWQFSAPNEGPQYNPAFGFPMQAQYVAPPSIPYQPLQVRPPSHVPQLPRPLQPPLWPNFPGTPIPPFPQSGTKLKFVDLFFNVVPKVGLPEYLATGLAKGWKVKCARNQVEAMAIMITEDAILQGISVSNPIAPGVVAKLKFIKIYSSGAAKGRPIFEQSPDIDLVGGDSVLTNVQLSQPVPLPNCQPHSIKIKIEAPAGHGDMMLYRGDGYPDVYESSEDKVWEFDRVRIEDLDNGKYSYGSIITGGPILRVIYSSY